MSNLRVQARSPRLRVRRVVIITSAALSLMATAIVWVWGSCAQNLTWAKDSAATYVGERGDTARAMAYSQRLAALDGGAGLSPR